MQDSKVDLIIFQIFQGVKCKASIFFLRTQEGNGHGQELLSIAAPAARATRSSAEAQNG
jgi:hypothetical protein